MAPHSVPTRESFDLTLDGGSLTWEDLEAVLGARTVRVRLDPAARRRMAEYRAGALDRLAQDPGLRIYGWNQALGPLKNEPLDAADQRLFQANVLKSHAAGVGENLSAPVARLALVLRANTLARGTSGARPELVERILEVVSAGITPLMPEIGSMGTGDLQPMAAAGLCLIGADVSALDAHGHRTTARQALAGAGLGEFSLEAGEAIALISGSAVFSACLASAAVRAQRDVETFLGGLAVFLEAARAEASGFDPRMHAERRIPTEDEAIEQILALVGGSQWMTEEGRRRAGETMPRIQDATSVRSVPHQLATVMIELQRTREALEREANASTCNPVVLPDGTGGFDVLMGGNWDCTLLGQAAQSLNVGMTRLAVLSKDLAGRLAHDGWSHGLPPSLSGGEVGLNSGMTLVHTTGASLIPEMQVRASPVSILSFPLKGGQEDHHTMAMASVRNLIDNLASLEVVLAVLLLMSAQGIDLLRETMGDLALSEGSSRVLGVVRSAVPMLVEDRVMSADVDAATDLVRRGRIAAVVESLCSGDARRGRAHPEVWAEFVPQYVV